MKELLESVQNFNGGGLSVSVTGKYTSVRHELARLDNKLTAGEAAKFVSKKLEIKMSAKDIVEAYHLLHNRLPEYHHSGFYKKDGKGTMGKTYFFTDDEIDYLIDNYSTIEAKKEDKIKELKIASEKIITGFYYVWDYDYSGKYGKKVNFKVLNAYKGSELNKPRRNFTACDEDTYVKVLAVSGKKYTGWDEPTLFDFK
jgi:hypothetical protein